MSIFYLQYNINVIYYDVNIKIVAYKDVANSIRCGIMSKRDYYIKNGDIELLAETCRLNEERKLRYAEYAQFIDEEVNKKTSDLVLALVEERKKQGLTQQNIADMIGVATSAIARFESRRCTPTFQFLEKYAVALGKNVEYRLV